MSELLPVITVTYSSGQYLEEFLSSLQAATTLSTQVVIADNGSDDQAPQHAVERHKNVKLFNTGSNLGYGRAINAAMAHLPSSEFVIIANPDIYWCPNSIDYLLQAAQRWPRAGALGPLIRQSDGTIYPSARDLPRLIRGGMHAVIGPIWKRNPWSQSYRQEHTYHLERAAGWLSGAALLIRRIAFEQIGGFDPRYFLYMEDVDLGDRLTQAGWDNVYVPSAQVIHAHGHSTERNPRAKLLAHHRSTYLYLADRYHNRYQAPLRMAIRAGLEARWRILDYRARRKLQRCQ